MRVRVCVYELQPPSHPVFNHRDVRGWAAQKMQHASCKHSCYLTVLLRRHLVLTGRGEAVHLHAQGTQPSECGLCIVLVSVLHNERVCVCVCICDEICSLQQRTLLRLLLSIFFCIHSTHSHTRMHRSQAQAPKAQPLPTPTGANTSRQSLLIMSVTSDGKVWQWDAPLPRFSDRSFIASVVETPLVSIAGVH